MLEIKNVTKQFGGLRAVNNVSLDVDDGEIVGLIGPNGAGKTTLLNLISGILRCTSGSIFLRNKRIDVLHPYQITKNGVGRTFQIPRPFKTMTVLENLLVPALALGSSDNKEEIIEKALNLLELVGLVEMRNEKAENLSGGQQKLLDIVRAIMLCPSVVLLDEPFAGVHFKLKEKIYDFILNLRKEYAFLVVSHDMQAITRICEKLVLLNEGAKIVEGPIEKLMRDPRLINVYLGE